MISLFDKEEFWTDKPRETVLGVEIEMMLYDVQKDSLLRSRSVRDTVISRINSITNSTLVSHDYYPYQLEIRSSPHENVDDIIAEVGELYRISEKEFRKENIVILPVSNLSLNEDAYCGTHVHVSLKSKPENPNDYLNQLYSIAWGSYPFILAIADITKNSMNIINNLFKATERIEESRHIGIPPFGNIIRNSHGDSNGWFDFTINNVNTDTKSVVTLEYRLFDTPSIVQYLHFMLGAIKAVVSNVRFDNPVMRYILEAMNENHDIESNSKLQLLREHFDKIRFSLNSCLYGYNSLLGIDNLNLMKWVGEKFGIKVPEVLQNEVIEKMKGESIAEKKILSIVSNPNSWSNIFGENNE